jgi:hypothetical protein
MVDVFERVGFGQWFRYLIALLELGGAALLLWPVDHCIWSAVANHRQRGSLSGAAARSA